MTVYLVGAGPGDPELLTLRAARLLGEADVVLHDRLIDPAVLQLAGRHSRLVSVGKDPNGRSVPQVQINELLIAYALTVPMVVRLKGGDPFVFGRGSEEADALARAGIETEVVPGVSSAIAGPGAVGVPVTARGVSSGVTIVTGHQCNDAENPIDWNAVARSGTTIVVLMGARHASRIAEQLLVAGMSGSMPVSVVVNATRADQRSDWMSLAQLRCVDRLANPCVITIGEVARRSGLQDQEGGVKPSTITARPLLV